MGRVVDGHAARLVWLSRTARGVRPRMKSHYRVICRFGQCLFQASADSEEDALEVAAKHTEAKGHPRVDVKPPPPRLEPEPA